MAYLFLVQLLTMTSIFLVISVEISSVVHRKVILKSWALKCYMIWTLLYSFRVPVFNGKNALILEIIRYLYMYIYKNYCESNQGHMQLRQQTHPLELLIDIV